jgi:hypothetical protein
LHLVLAALWLALVALDWPGLSSGPVDERLQTAVPLLFGGWVTLAVALFPDPPEADAIRRVMRVQILVNAALVVLAVAWARWEIALDGHDLKVLVFPLLPASLLGATVWQFFWADRTAAKARERENASTHG